MTRRRIYLKNAMLLTASGLVLRMLGMGFRVILSAYLGGEGMGLYQLILALYMVFVALATAGVPVGLPPGWQPRAWRGDRASPPRCAACAQRLWRWGQWPWWPRRHWRGRRRGCSCMMPGPKRPLRVLAPSLPFMAVAGALRGCFLAARRVTPNVVAQLIEQLVRMAVAVAGLRVMARWGAGYGCAAVVLGNTVSEGVSCCLMVVFAVRDAGLCPPQRGTPAPLHPAGTV